MPISALSLRLARATIKMRHGARWKVDKVNPVHDLVICLTGRAHYRIGADEELEIGPGDAMLIPAYRRFRGRHLSGDTVYTGIAQHFSLDLFGRGDVISQMDLARKVSLSNWDTLEHLVRHYRASSQQTTATLSQQHQFMVLLLAYLEDAFTGWKKDETEPESQDRLSLQIMFAASHLATDPLGGGLEEALANIPYNADYFRRAFRDRIGLTPRKYRELKRMEYAVSRLSMGLAVKEVALELGYSNPYFFSRMFKRYLGASPAHYRAKEGATGEEP